MIKELMITFFACLVIGAVMNGSPPQPPAGETTATPVAEQSSSESENAEEAPPGEQKALETSDASFDQDVLQSNVPVLVDFKASWCQPCKHMAPVVEKLAEQYDGKIKVYIVDTDSSPGLKEKYQINALPTFMVFRGGRSVASHTGQMPQEMLAGVIDRQLGTQ